MKYTIITISIILIIVLIQLLFYHKKNTIYQINQIVGINNNIRKIGNTIEDNDLKKELALKQIRETYKCNVQRLKNKYDSEVKEVIEMYKKKTEDLRGEMERLDKMPELDKVKCFREKIVNEKGDVEFWKFFEYMKDRVHDIENIWFDKN